jgi:flagellar P-ring protein precursor FlgI
MGRIEKGFLVFLWVLTLLMVADFARAERIKDIASIGGVRENQLVGYGIVVGLDGTGDQTTQTPFTVQSMINMLSAMGVSLPPGQSLQLKNVAAVMVTSSLPAFARAGQSVDVTVSSIGNAKSLKGGTLIMTPLKGADGQVYAVAQGNLAVAGAGGSSGAGGAKVTVNHLAVGRIPNGATVEREVATAVGQGEFATIDLNTADFATAQRVADAINKLSPGAAQASDSRQIKVRMPEDRIAFLGKIEALEVKPSLGAAKVIVNSRTGSVVMNRAVTLDNFAVAHGNLSVAVSGEGGGSVDIKQEGGGLLNVKASPTLADVVKALNSIGATPLDLVAILQAMRSAGALRADLEII